MAEQNPFDAPIPGQSLTDEPGSRNWEKPPKFARPQEALDYIWGRMTEEPQTVKLLALLENGLPAQGVAETILFAGFSEGLWTPDVMLLIGKPVLAMVAALGKRAGIEVKIGSRDRDELDDFLEELAGSGAVRKRSAPDMGIQPETVNPETENQDQGGLMGMKGVM